MNLRKGLSRLTWVVSIAIGIFLGAAAAEPLGAIVLGLAGFGAVWIVYGAAAFVVAGFTDRRRGRSSE